MKRIKSWLETKFSQPKPDIAPDQPSDPVGVETDDIVSDACTVEISFDPKVPGRLESEGEGKSVLMPDIYTDEHAPTVPDLKVLDESSADIDKSSGFNPYDTAVLQKKSS